MPRLLALAVLLVGALMVGSVQGLGASLGVATGSFWSGLAPISTCDRDGVTASYNTTLLLTVTSVTVSAISDGSATVGAGACDGRTVTVVLLGSSGAPISGATGTRVLSGDANTSADSAIVPLTLPPLTLSVARARITIT